MVDFEGIFLDREQRLTAGIGNQFYRRGAFDNPAHAKERGFWERASTDMLMNLGTQMAISGAINIANWGVVDPDFDPLADENIRGFEAYARWLRHAKNPRMMDQMKGHIRFNEEVRAEQAVYSDVWSGIAGGVVDPINWIGLSGVGILGRGFLRGALGAALVNAPIIAGGEMLIRPRVDPTSTPEEQFQNTLWGLGLTALLGGVAGKISAIGHNNAVARRFAREAEAEARVWDAGAEGRTRTGAEAIHVQPREFEGTGTVLRETISRGDEVAGAAAPRARTALTDQMWAAVRAGQTSIDNMGPQDILVAARHLYDQGGLQTREAFEEFIARFNEAQTPEARAQVVNEAVDAARRSDAPGAPAGQTGVESLRAAVEDALRNFDEVAARGPANAAATFEDLTEGTTRANRPSVRVGSRPTSAQRYEARPTGEVSPGAQGTRTGAEQVIRIFPFGRLVQSGVQAFADLALMTAHDMSIGLARNLGQIASPHSAFAMAFRWRAMALEVTRKLERLHNEYLTDGASEGGEILGINVATSGGRMLDRFRGSRADGKMTYAQFEDSIFRAFRETGIESSNPYVSRGAQLVHGFFETARKDGYATGVLWSKAGAHRRYNAIRQMISRDQARIDELLSPDQPVPEGHVRLARVEARDRATPNISDWLRESPEFQSAQRAEGRWFVMADDTDNIRWYQQHLANDGVPSRVVYVDVPADQVESFRVSARPEGDEVRGFSRRPDEEFFVSPEIAARRRPLESRQPSAREQHAATYLQEKVARLTRELEEIELRVVSQDQRLYDIAADIMERAERRRERLGERQTDLHRQLNEQMDRDVRVFLELHQLYNDGLGLTDRQLRYYELLTERLARVFDPMRRDFDLPDFLAYATENQQRFDELLNQLQQQPLTRRQAEYMESIQRRLAMLDDDAARPGLEQYLPRIWDRQAILARRQEFEDILTRHFTNTARQTGRSASPDAVQRRVQATVTRILGEDLDIDELSGFSGKFFFQRARKVDIPNELVADFVERGVASLMRTYSHGFGISTEIARMFGKRDMLDAIDDASFAAALEGKSPRQVRALRNDAMTLRDITTGDLYRQDPMTWGKLAVTTLKSWASMTQLGGVALTAVAEIARPFWVTGFRRGFGFAFRDMSRNFQAVSRMGQEWQALTGEGLDTALGISAYRYMSSSDLHVQPGTTMAQRASNLLLPVNRFAQGPWYIMNLLGPFTDLMKRYQLVMSAHYVIDDIQRVANGQAGPKVASRLAGLGLSPESIARIAALTRDQRSGRLWLPDTASWGDPNLIAEMAAAVGGEVRRVIATPGPAETAAWMSGHFGKPGSRRYAAIAELPFQYMRFAFGATTKYMISGLQGRDASKLMGPLAMVAAGYLSVWLKTPGYAWDKLDMEERLYRAVDQSSMLGIFHTLNQSIEDITDTEYGMRPLLGLEKRFEARDMADRFGPAYGPGGSKILDLARVVSGDFNDREAARVIRRGIPLATLFYWDALFRNLEAPIEAGVGAIRDQF